MGRGVLLILFILTSACAWTYPPRDPKIALRAPQAALPDLLAAPVPIAYVESPFELRFYPAIVMAGQGTWLTCFVPPSWHATRVALRFEGKFATEYNYEHHAPRFVDHIPCGQWTAACAVRLPTGLVRTLTRTLETAGDCQ